MTTGRYSEGILIQVIEYWPTLHVMYEIVYKNAKSGDRLATMDRYDAEGKPLDSELHIEKDGVCNLRTAILK